MTKDNALTHKQRLFVDKFTDPKARKTFLNQTQTMLAMGSKTVKSAGVGGYMMAKKPHVKAAIIEALHKIKITPMYQAKKLKELMESNVSIYHEGVKIDTVPDNKTRHSALVTSLKITDAIENLEKVTQGISINISPEMCQRLIGLAQEMKAMREKHSKQVIPLVKEIHAES